MKQSSFGLAPIKGEGQSLNTVYGFAEDYVPPPPKYETTYVERRVPVELENEAHKLLDTWLKSKGYDLEHL